MFRSGSVPPRDCAKAELLFEPTRIVKLVISGMVPIGRRSRRPMTGSGPDPGCAMAHPGKLDDVFAEGFLNLPGPARDQVQAPLRGARFGKYRHEKHSARQ
jgi:hypothetical protein